MARWLQDVSRSSGATVLRGVCALLSLSTQPALADQATTTAPAGTPNRAVAASADLDFIINIGKFIFFRVGTGTYPTASATVDTVSFSVAPTIPAANVVPVTGNNTAVNWNGALPGFSVTATNAVLPVEVRSNAGQINIKTNVVTALTSGANAIALSQIVVTSSDTNLPAPPVPNTGTGTAVNVAGTSFSNLVTQRSANWTFAYSPAAIPPAGAYTGQISFTASSP